MHFYNDGAFSMCARIYLFSTFASNAFWHMFKCFNLILLVMCKIGMILRARKACADYSHPHILNRGCAFVLPLSKYYTLAHTSSIVRQINQEFLRKI